MRSENDYSPDIDVKLGLYATHVSPYYNVAFAIDDRKHIIDLWRSIGIPALHCTDN